LGNAAVPLNLFADLVDKTGAVRCLSMRVLDLEKPVATEIAPPLRVLLLEESDADSQEILQELRSAGMAIETTVIARRVEFLEAVSSQDYSVIFPAYKLPEWSDIRKILDPVALLEG
jgi:hypothetical protein